MMGKICYFPGFIFVTKPFGIENVVSEIYNSCKQNHMNTS